MTRASVELPTFASKPYKGPESYQTEDAHLFFGRDDISEQLIARILSSRATLVHAQSGAGKTSLLNTLIIPGLESHGWSPVRIRPEDDPAQSTRLAMLHQLIPSPEEEAQALERAVAALPHEAGLDPAFESLLHAYSDLSSRDERRRALVAPVDVDRSSRCGVAATEGKTIPFVCRAMRGSLDIHRLAEHLAALTGEPHPATPYVERWTPVGSLISALRSRVARDAYLDLLDQLLIPVQEIHPFVENWWEVWASRHHGYALVFILDQFEELFTRYADPGPTYRLKTRRPLDWRIREKFFDELNAMYDASKGTHEAGAQNGSRQSLNIRYVLSLRSEYLGYRDRLPAFAGSIDKTAFHVPLLSVDEARVAIEGPAMHYGYRYSNACFDDMLRKLAKEGRWVEPAHLQIVCEKLWTMGGQLIVDASGESDNMPEITEKLYRELGSAEGILRNFVSEFIKGLAPSDRLEAIEILESLITTSGTRNIVEYNELLGATLGSPEQRALLLDDMQRRAIVRVEWRLGAMFVEITHEFLIDSIITAGQSELYGATDTARFVDARRALRRAVSSDFRRARPEGLLTVDQIKAIHEANEQVDWRSGRAIEVMFRAAVANAIEVDKSDPTLLKFWQDRLRAATDNQEQISGQFRKSNPHYTPTAPILGRIEEPRSGATAEFSARIVRRPLEIVDEFLLTGSRATQESAVRALGSFGDAESIKKLVGIALEERGLMATAAAKRLFELDGESQAAAISGLTAALEYPADARRAYELLSAWYSRGVDIKPPNLDWQKRRALVREADRLDRRRRREFIRTEALNPGFVGSLAGFFAALVLLTLAVGGTGEIAAHVGEEYLFVVLVATVVLIAPIMVLAATRTMRPIHQHLDQRVATLLEIGRAAMGAIAPIPIGLVVGVVLMWHSDEDAFLVFGIAATAIVLAAVRAGTLIAYEAFSHRTSTNRLVQTATGTATGLLAVILTAQIALRIWPTLNQGATLVVTTVAALICSCAISYAYAKLEVAVEPTRPIFGGWSRAGTLIVVLIAYLPILLAAVLAAKSTAGRDEGILRILTSSKQTITVPLPGRIQFQIDERNPGVEPRRDGRVPVTIGSPDEAAPTLAFTIERVDSLRGATFVDYDDRSTYYEGALAPGRYNISVQNATSVHAGDVWQEVSQRLKDGLLGRAAREQITIEAYLPTAAELRAAEERLAGVSRDPLTAAQDAAFAAESLAQASFNARGDLGGRLALQALDSFRVALERGGDSVISPVRANNICWYGALSGRARQFVPQCDYAVSRNPTDGMVIDSRGLALALSGSPELAKKDFLAFIAWTETNGSALATGRPRRDSLIRYYKETRSRWIKELDSTGTLSLTGVRQDVARHP